MKESELNIKLKIWKTKDGTEIPVKKMTDNHIINTLKMLKRKEAILDEFLFPYIEWIDIFQDELRKRKINIDNIQNKFNDNK